MRLELTMCDVVLSRLYFNLLHSDLGINLPHLLLQDIVTNTELKNVLYMYLSLIICLGIWYRIFLDLQRRKLKRKSRNKLPQEHTTETHGAGIQIQAYWATLDPSSPLLHVPTTKLVHPKLLTHILLLTFLSQRMCTLCL